jgi:malic enzyme
MFNKGTAFPHGERRALGLLGLLPTAVSTMEQQSRRAYANIVRKAEPLERYIGLAALQDRNEVLFHRVLADHLEELLPYVYAPTVALACRDFSRIFRRGRGLWITPGQRGEIAAALENAPFEDVRLVVVTDNERVLGLGDLGVGGIGLPIGKLAVYTAAAGIHPAHTLPVCLDVGTDNRALLDDELYLGWRHERLRGEEYDSLVEEFVHALRQRFPRAILQWEDFKRDNAFRLLAQHRHSLASWNDDIQGSAVLALAAALGAGRLRGVHLAEQRFVIVGAGVAGIGIARLLKDQLRRAGLSVGETLGRVAVLDSRGLLVESVEQRDMRKRELAWSSALAQHAGLKLGARDLASVVRALKPTVLIGASGQPGLFTQPLLRELADYVERPVVLLLSQPHSRCEARAEDVEAATGGRALVATAAEATTALAFPAIALGTLVSEAREVSDGMLAAAAGALSDAVPDAALAGGRLFPPLRELREVAARAAVAVARQAAREDLGRVFPEAALEPAVRAAMWEPRYLPLVAAPEMERAGQVPDRELCAI